LKIGLLEAQYYYTYLAMLKRRVSFFYYDKIVGRMYDFQIIVVITKTYFETENYQKYLFKWRETTLICTISENLDKT
jgi:hypothetical protein